MNQRKIYYRFEDIPNDYGHNTGSEKIGLKFSKNEFYQILIAILVLTIAFSFALAPYPPLANFSYVLSNLPLSFFAIITAFFCHEIAHKYMGQKFGYWSEFRMYSQGLLLALFLGIFTGFIFAAPGAVQIRGMPNKDEMGKIALAGPLTNIVLSSLFITLWIVSTGLISQISFFIGYINAFLALFNLIPFGFFDGKKIFTWRKEIWFMLIVVSIVLFLIIF
jgi:Zn-dependent protease